MSNEEKFWLTDPCALYASCKLVPTKEMTTAERLNAMTRLLLIITFILYLFGFKQYWTVLILGLLLIIILYSNKPKENFSPHRGNNAPCNNCGLPSTNAYINSKYEESPQVQYNQLNYGLRSYNNHKYAVKPVDTPAPYREIWRNEQRYCNEFNMNPNSYTVTPISDLDQPDNRCYYEDRSFISRPPQYGCGDRRQTAMPAIESSFMRDSTMFRNMIMGDIVDQIGRTRQHNCVNFKPGRKTF